MKCLVWPLLAFVLFVLQSTCLGFFSGELLFDLPLLFVYNYALLRGAVRGTLCGVALGLLQDLLTPQIFGFHLLTRAATGMYCGSVRELLFKGNSLYHMTVVLVVTFLTRTVLLLPLFMFNGAEMLKLLPLFAFNAVLCAAGNALLNVPLGELMRRIGEWMSADDLSWNEPARGKCSHAPLSLNGKHLNRDRSKTH